MLSSEFWNRYNRKQSQMLMGRWTIDSATQTARKMTTKDSGGRATDLVALEAWTIEPLLSHGYS